VNGIITWTDGYKTYIAALAGGIYGVLITAGVTPNRTSVWLTIASVALYGIRSAATKLTTAVVNGSTPLILNEGNDSTVDPALTTPPVVNPAP
jgi:hypothetical protein